MAGSAEVMQGITRVPGVRYRALVPNERGTMDALACNVDEIEVVMSISETHNYKNLNMSPDESVTQIIGLTELAHQEKTPVEAILSTAFGCAYEGDISPKRVAQYARKVLDEAGVDGLSFGDTSGMATPRVVSELLDALEEVEIDISQIGLHFHNTRKRAWPTLCSLCKGEFHVSMLQLEDWVAAHILLERPATWLPKMWCTWLRIQGQGPVSISIN